MSTELNAIVFFFLQAVLKRRLIWKEKNFNKESKRLRMIIKGGRDSVNDEGFTIYIYLYYLKKCNHFLLNLNLIKGGGNENDYVIMGEWVDQ